MKKALIYSLGFALAFPVAGLAQQSDGGPQSPQANMHGSMGQMQGQMQSQMQRSQMQRHMMMVRDEREQGSHGSHGMSSHHEEGPFWKSPSVVQRLGITPEQVTKLDAIDLAGKLESIQLHAALEEQEVKMRASMESSTFDEKAADLEIDRMADAHAALEKAEAKVHVSERAVLTADQWTKMHTPMEHHSMGHGQGQGQPGSWQHHTPQTPATGNE